MKPIGYNVLSTDAALWAHLDRLQPSVLLFMDGWAAAKQAQERYPVCKVIHRVFDANEDKLHRTPGATLAHLQARASERQHNSVYINLSCEPQIPTDDDLRKLNDEQLKALQWAVANGVRVAAPHLAHYGIDGLRWRIIEPLFNYIADHSDLLLFTCDEYAAGHMFSGVVDPSLVGGSEIGHIAPETWKRSPVPKYWHCGRITDYFRDRQARGLKLPLTVITEYGLDALGDVTAWRNTLLRTSGYSDIRGWKSLRVQHEAWYGPRGWSVERAYAEMLTACWKEIYAPFPNVLGVCIYCYGTNNDVQWDQFRVDGAAEFLSLMERTAMANLIPPTELGTHARCTDLPGTDTYRNIRGTVSDTGAGGADIGDLHINDEVYVHPATSATFGWRYLKRASDGLQGWVKDAAGLVFTAISYVPPTEAEWEAAKAERDALAADKLRLTTDVNNWRLFASSLRADMQNFDKISVWVNAIDSQLETSADISGT